MTEICSTGDAVEPNQTLTPSLKEHAYTPRGVSHQNAKPLRCSEDNSYCCREDNKSRHDESLCSLLTPIMRYGLPCLLPPRTPLFVIIGSSVRTRDELFADDFSPINTARSSASSQYSGAGRPPSGHDRKQKQNPKQQQQQQQRQQHQQHQHQQQQQQQQQQKRNQQRNQQQLHQQKSRVTDDDDESESDSDGDTTPLSSPCREQSARNFDDDDSSKEEVSVDEMNFWPQSGYADGNGGGGGCGYPRGSSGGSATVEDSWNTGMGRALDDDTPSNSRIGSSGRSSSRSSVRKPSRRYLVEQNRLREGW